MPYEEGELKSLITQHVTAPASAVNLCFRDKINTEFRLDQKADPLNSPFSDQCI